MSDLEYCPTCQNPTSVNAPACPSCGEPLLKDWAEDVRAERADMTRQQKRRDRRRVLMRSSILAIILTSAFFYQEIGNTFTEYRLSFLSMFSPDEYKTRILTLEDEAETVAKEDIKAGLVLYQFLKIHDPENTVYAKKVKILKSEIAAAEVLKIKQDEAAAITQKTEQEQAKKAAKVAEEKAEALKKRKGFHCLFGWDGEIPALVRYMKKNIREPDSFQHIETRITPVDKTGYHRLTMSFRSRNGFGGMSDSLVAAKVKNSDCSFTVTNIKG